MDSNDHEAAVIQSGIQFMRSIKTAYGFDKGAEIWSKIEDTLDSEIKNKILVALLTGEYDSTITLSVRW